MELRAGLLSLSLAVLCLGWGTQTQAGPGGAVAEVEFTVLSYNVHGLPAWVARDEPERRMPAIAKLLNAYDVVLAQEDWVHHQGLVRGAGHPVVERGSNAEGGWLESILPSTGSSGLTVLARVPRRNLVRVDRDSYGSCSGWLGGANDCWSSKGLLRLRLRLPPGLVVDFYDTHLDAGDGPDDRAVRRDQLEVLGERIRALSEGRAVVLAGDFNLDDGDAEERELLAGFASSLGLSNSRAVPGKPWSRIDYIFFRSGQAVQLELLEAAEDRDFVQDGKPLSDHPAMFARFRAWSTRPEAD